MKIVVAVTEPVMAAVMKRAEVMHIAEVATRPVSGIEMMANARMAHGTVAHTPVSNSGMSSDDMSAAVCHASSDVAAAAEYTRRLSHAGMRRHHATNGGMPNRSVTDAPVNNSHMAAAEMRPAAKRTTTHVSRAPDVSAPNMTSTDMPAAVTGMSSSMSPVDSSSMSSAMLREKRVREKLADGHAQYDCEPCCGNGFPPARSNGRSYGWHVHNSIYAPSAQDQTRGYTPSQPAR